MDRIFQDRGFCIHLAVYAAVNILLLIINLQQIPVIFGFSGRLLAGDSGSPATPISYIESDVLCVRLSE